MSANCLVTKLKSVVNNDNLLKLDEMRVTFNANSTLSVSLINMAQNPITFYFSEPVTINSIASSTTLASNVTSYTASEGIKITSGSAETSCKFASKSNITILDANFRVKNITYENIGVNFPYLDSFSAEYATTIKGLNLDALKYLNPSGLKYLRLLNVTNWGGNIDEVLNVYASTGRTINLTLQLSSAFTINGQTAGRNYIIRFNGSMVNPTAEDTARGWQIA